MRTRKSYEPRAYWSTTKRLFKVTYFIDGIRHDKWVPAAVAYEETHQHVALIWFVEWRGHCEKAGYIPSNLSVPPPKKSFQNLIDQWRDWRLSLPNTKADTIESDTSCIKLWLLPHKLGSFDLERPKGLTIAVVSWIEWLQKQTSKKMGRPLSPNTVRNIVGIARTMLSDFRGKGWCDLAENPFSDPFVRKKTADVEPIAGKDNIIHLTPSQALQLILCGDEWIIPIRKATNCLGLTSGLRAQEVQGLAWEHLQLEDEGPNGNAQPATFPYVDVQRQLKRGNSGDPPIFAPPKKKSYRQVPLHPLTVSVLLWWKEQWEVWVGRRPMPSDPVFPTSEGHWTGHSKPREFRKDLVTAGIDPLFDGKFPQTIHSMRRTFLTMLSLSGVTDDHIARLAGHAKKSITSRHYVAKDLPQLYKSVLMLPLPHHVAWTV